MQILTDHVRRKRAAKRGADPQRVTLSGLATPAAGDLQVDLVALDGALTKLSGLSPRQGRIVEMCFLAGMEMKEVARVLGLTPRTVSRDWRAAKAFLQCELTGDSLE